MLSRRITPKEQEAKDRAFREARVARIRQLRTQIDKKAALVKGIDFVFQLDGGRKLEFRGRKYGVPPVPWSQACRLIRLQERHQALFGEPSLDLTESEAIRTELSDVFKQVVRPLSLIQRLFWRWLPSPALDPLPQEVSQLLLFFSVCLSQDQGESPAAVRQVLQRPRATSRSSSGGSSRTSRRGATNGASR